MLRTTAGGGVPVQGERDGHEQHARVRESGGGVLRGRVGEKEQCTCRRRAQRHHPPPPHRSDRRRPPPQVRGVGPITPPGPTT